MESKGITTKPIWWDYLVFYPYDDEEEYDGIHDGGIKGLRSDAPEDVKKAYWEHQRNIEAYIENRKPIPK